LSGALSLLRLTAQFSPPASLECANGRLDLTISRKKKELKVRRKKGGRVIPVTALKLGISRNGECTPTTESAVCFPLQMAQFAYKATPSATALFQAHAIFCSRSRFIAIHLGVGALDQRLHRTRRCAAWAS
jgi:hypothetical protein